MFLIDWPGGSWEATLRMTLTVLAIYLVVLWVTLVFWTYRDIRQRTRDPILQTVAVVLVLVFFLPGHWIYLILRPRYTLTELYERSLEEEALLQELEDQKACPGCNRRIQDDFLLCPYCRASLKEPCAGCSKPLNRAWQACPYCGVEKPAPVRPPQRQQGRVTRGPRAPVRARAANRAQRQRVPMPEGMSSGGSAPPEAEIGGEEDQSRETANTVPVDATKANTSEDGDVQSSTADDTAKKAHGNGRGKGKSKSKANQRTHNASPEHSGAPDSDGEPAATPAESKTND